MKAEPHNYLTLMPQAPRLSGNDIKIGAVTVISWRDVHDDLDWLLHYALSSDLMCN
jgi:hypothetical protein